MSNWIKCSKEMPKDYAWVLVCFGWHAIEVRYWDPKMEKWYPGGRDLWDDDHWMPLPEYPERT